MQLPLTVHRPVAEQVAVGRPLYWLLQVALHVVPGRLLVPHEKTPLATEGLPAHTG